MGINPASEQASSPSTSRNFGTENEPVAPYTDTDEQGGRVQQAVAKVRSQLSSAADVEPQQLTQFLGWFSIGLGLTEILAPRALGRAIGVGENHTTIMRACGLREVANGLALLSQKSPQAWAWARVGGDALDLALLGAAARQPYADRRRIAAASAAVLGVTALDIYAGQR